MFASWAMALATVMSSTVPGSIGNINGSNFDEYVWNDTFGFNSGASAAMDIITTLGNMIHPTGSDPVPTILSISYAWSADDTSFISSTEYT
jgi:hypothetical protein